MVLKYKKNILPFRKPACSNFNKTSFLYAMFFQKIEYNNQFELIALGIYILKLQFL